MRNGESEKYVASPAQMALQEERVRLRRAADALYRHEEVVRQITPRARLSEGDRVVFFPSATALTELLASVMAYARAAGHAGMPVNEMLDGVSDELRRTALRRAPAPLGGDVRADAVRKAVRAYYEALRVTPALHVS
jgi:hypothetical protein